MDITYSFVDGSDTYVGHARYDGFIYGDTYYRASTRAVTTLADAAAAITELRAAISARFPAWEACDTEPRLEADRNHVGHAVRVIMQYASRGAS